MTAAGSRGTGSGLGGMTRDDARKMAREVLRELGRRERNAGTSGFLSYKLLRRLMVHAQLVGVRLDRYVPGPWTVGETEPKLWGRLGALLPTVERGAFTLMVPDEAEASALSPRWAPARCTS
jgi:hypothetical protein